MTIKKNFNFISNSNEENNKVRHFNPVYNANYNYMDSYLKEDRFAYNKINYEDQRLKNLQNYNTDFKQFDQTTSKFTGIY